jgi:hypothetical protein
LGLRVSNKQLYPALLGLVVAGFSFWLTLGTVDFNTGYSGGRRGPGVGAIVDATYKAEVGFPMAYKTSYVTYHNHSQAVKDAKSAAAPINKLALFVDVLSAVGVTIGSVILIRRFYAYIGD